MSKMTKKEMCLRIVGKTVGEMQRLLKQYDFKFNIDKYDDIIADVPKTNKNKTIHIEIEDNIVVKAI